VSFLKENIRKKLFLKRNGVGRKVEQSSLYDTEANFVLLRCSADWRTFEPIFLIFKHHYLFPASRGTRFSYHSLIKIANMDSVLQSKTEQSCKTVLFFQTKKKLKEKSPQNQLIQNT